MRNPGIAAVITLALALAGASLASGNATADNDRHRPRETITVLAKTAQLNLVDLGDPGFTLGDQIAFSDDLHGMPAGTDGAVCTLTRILDANSQSGTAQCLVTYSLKGGQITTQGLLTLTQGGFIGTQRAAITGGTGRYSGARGESTLEFIRPGELKVTLTVH